MYYNPLRNIPSLLGLSLLLVGISGRLLVRPFSVSTPSETILYGTVAENFGAENFGAENFGELEAENFGELEAENVGELEAENVGELEAIDATTERRDDGLPRPNGEAVENADDDPTLLNGEAVENADDQQPEQGVVTP
ncbi:MAG: hypothetical protein LBG59_03495 [Candidatus Peribacteria bacterium]|jgi:hypothetical protein|nr:hypothetical protein [Candidatus Peribacteria bacterium]